MSYNCLCTILNTEKLHHILDINLNQFSESIGPFLSVNPITGYKRFI